MTLVLAVFGSFLLVSGLLQAWAIWVGKRIFKGRRLVQFALPAALLAVFLFAGMADGQLTVDTTPNAVTVDGREWTGEFGGSWAFGDYLGPALLSVLLLTALGLAIATAQLRRAGGQNP